MAEETRQQKRVRERRERAILGPTYPTRLAPEDKGLRSWQIAMGAVPALFLASGIVLMLTGPDTFWAGYGMTAAALIWLALDWYFYSDRFAVRMQFAVYGLILLSAVFLFIFAFRPMPLRVSLSQIAEHYATDSNIDGIKWKANYTGFRAFLVNDSDFQYTNLDFLVRTDILIAEIGFNAKFSQCTAEPTLPGLMIGGVSITTSEGTSYPTTPAGANVFHVYCDKILPRSQIEMTVATRPDLRGGFPDAASAQLTGSFDAYFQSRPIDAAECLVKGCSLAP
jgi:hypothetical protein